ncbi:MAG: carboxypeptidase regulatory-like domain-containing protein [Anaerolineae bacterium]
MHTRWFNFLVLLSLVFGLLPVTAAQAASETSPLAQPAAQAGADIEVEPALRLQLAADETTGYLIYFKEKPDLSPAYKMDWIARGRFVANALNQTALRSQARVRAYLDAQGAKYKAFWIENVISVESSNRATFNGLLNFAEISAIRQHRQLGLIEPTQVQAPSAPQAVEPNIAHVGADQVWAQGYTGEGMVVANIDTGVRYTHQALVNHYRGNLGGTFDHNYNWWDPYGDHPTSPADDNGHGSHTMGTMVGDDGGANQIGMAPGAQWIACRGCNTSSCADTALLECAQFIAAPWDLNEANANPDKRPNAVNNSWGDCSQSYDPWYQDVVNAWHAAGIYPVFSNGNASNCGYPEPPGLNTVGNPARYGNVTGVGSTGRDNGQYASHSNWGPTDNPDTVNPHPGWEDLKPQVLAPGVNIRSSVNTGDTAYQGGWSGTSMSAPHVTGLIALMWQAAPCLVGDYATTENIIENTATPIPYDDGTGGGAHVPNYATGWGEINALAAVLAAADECGDSAITGRVTDASTSAAVGGAKIIASNATVQRKATSDAAGFYAMTVFSGTYTLSASRYGYQTTVVPNVAATTGQTTTQNIALTPAAFYEVSGKVTDATTGWPLYAHITISGDPVDPIAPDNAVWTDPATGEYSVMLAEGVTYTFKVEAWVAGYDAATGAVGPLTQDATADFALQANMSTCTAPGYYFSGGLMANFEDKTFPPAGWTVVNNGGSCTWQSGAIADYGNYTGGDGNYADANSDACGPGTTMNTDLISPPFDASGLTQVNLAFAYDYNNYTSGEVAAVDVSPDNGATWVNIVTWGTDQRGPATFTQDVTAILGGSTQARVRFHYYAPSWDWWWQVDNVVLGNPVCNAPASGGLVVGNVYDENYPTVALNGATVANAGGETTAVATPGDPAVDDAFYTFFAPSGPQTFTATMKGGYGPDVATVTVVDGDTVEHDFFLPAGLLSATPTGLNVTVELGYTAARTLTLANAGGVGAAFELKERKGNVVPIHIAAYTGALPPSDVPVSTGKAPQGKASTDESEALVAAPLADAVPAYAIDLFTGNLVAFMSDTPGTWTVIGNTGIGGPFAGDFLNGDFSQMYVLDYDTNGFYVVDTATAAATLVGTSAPLSGHVWTGMSGSVDGTLYAASTNGSQSYLYTIDPATGVATVIGEITNAPVIIDIAISADGNMYGVEIMNDVLVSIDPATGAGTVIGSLGFNASYAQGMDFEEESGVLYLAAFNVGTFQGEFRIADTATGNTVLVGGFPGGAEVDCLAFATGGSADVPWLAEVPTAGSVPAGGNTAINVDFDAAYVDQPGEYHADLIVKNDTPYGKFSVPVTMTVTAPKSWGKLTGTVTGLGICDNHPALLEEAEVRVESATTGQTWLVETGADGKYHLWLDQAHSPVTITVTAPDYFGVTGGVVVRQDQVTVVDFDLRLLKPCLSYNPADFEVTLPMGENTDQQLTLNNTGAGTAEYELLEIVGGFVPMRTTNAVVKYLSMPAATNGPVNAIHNGTLSNAESRAPYIYYSGAPQAVSIIAYADDDQHNPTAVEAALQALGLSYTFYGYDTTGNNLSAFVAAVQAGGWDLVIYAADSWALIDASDYQAVADHINGGGMAIAQSWAIGYDAAHQNHVLWSLLGGSYAGWLTSPASLYWWNPAHPIFSGVPEFTNLDNLGYSAYGARMNLVGDPDTGLGGFTTAPADGQAGVILSNANRTIYKGLTDNLNSADVDSDGAWDVTEWWTNAVNYILNPGMFGGGIPWLTETPVTGTVAADANAVVDLTFDAGVPETMQPGTYYGQLKVSSNAANEVANVPVTLTVTPPATWGKIAGTVTGLGYCDSATPVPLEGALVYIETATGLLWELTTDANGAYVFWLDAAHGPVTITVQADGHITQVFNNVPVTAGQTTTRDAALRWNQPCLSVDPALFDVTVTLGMSTTLPLSLINQGAGAATFDMVEVNGGMMPFRLNTTRHRLASSVSQVTPDEGAPQSWAAYVASGLLAPAAQPVAPVVPAGAIQGVDFYYDRGAFNADYPGLPVEGYENGTMAAGTLDAIPHPLDEFSDNAYFDPGDILPGIQFWATNDHSGDELVVLGANFMGNPSKTAAANYFADSFHIVFNPPVLAAGMDLQEFMGGYSCQVDVFDADGVLLGSDVATCDEAGVFWGVASDTNLIGEIVITSLAGGAQGADNIAFGGTLPEIPWLSENPESGTVDPDSISDVDLTFDAGVPEVPQPGTYFGTLAVNSDDPVNNKIVVPVTMTVVPPATWGKLMGTVTGLGYCDADPHPLAGAEVLVESWMTETVMLTTTTTLLNEGFEGTFPPAGWTLFESQADDPGWLQSATAHSGSGSAWHNDDNLAASSDAWLISPQVSVPASGAMLSFWERDFYSLGSYYVYHGVLVTTDANPDPGTATYTELYSGDVGTTWAENTLDLSAYAGQNIYIAFRYSGDYADEWYVDDVLVTGESASLTVVPVSWALTTDISGTYQVWVDEMYSPVTITVAYPDYQKGEAIAVITGGNTTTWDFDLRMLAPCVQVNPSALHAELELGATASTVMTLTNTGVVDTDWTLLEENLGAPTVTPPGVVALFAEDFEGAFPPAGWTRVENIGSCDWESSATTGYANQTGGSGLFADANSDWCGTGMDVELWTPAIDLSAAAAPVLSFQSDFNDYGGSDDGYVDISTDGGATWTNLLHYDGVDVRGPYLEQVDLSAYAGQPGVIIRFHYVAPDWDWYWQVDDVQIADVDPVVWLAENPTSGNLAADTGVQVVDVDFDAAAVAQPGDYVANLRVNSADPFAPTIVPVTMTVTPPADWGQVNGVVYSLGRCDAEMKPLAGAEVVIWDDGGSAIATVTTDAAGAYHYWLPTGDYTLTVTAADHVPAAPAPVNVSAAGVVTQDFSLFWIGPCVSAETVEYHLTLAMGMSGTLPMTLTNTGLGNANFALSDVHVGFVPSGLLMTTRPAPAYPPVSGGEVAELVGTEAPKVTTPVPSAIGQTSVPYAPVAALYDNGPLVNSPGTGAGGADESMLQTVSLGMGTYGFGHQAAYGYRVADDFTVTGGGWFVDTITFYAYQTGSGLVSTISAVNLQIWNGVPDAPGSSVVFGDPTTNRLVNTTWSGIYRVSETSSGDTTRPIMANTVKVGVMLPPGTYWLDWQADGTLSSGPWAPPVTINGQATTGNALQYLGAWGAALDTGTGTQQDFPFVIEGADAPWLFEIPATGIVPAGDHTVVDILMDADFVSQPGEYYAQILLATSDPGMMATYPATLTVTVPDTYGQITGTVMGLGPCDNPATAVALEGAEVIVESATRTWTLFTNKSGGYSLWLDAAHSPVTITVNAAGYLAESVAGVPVAAEQTTTQNFGLSPEAPCLSVAPTSIHETVTLGDSAQVPMTIGNTGTADLNWAISETGGGYTALRPAPAGFAQAGLAPALAATTVSPASTVVVAPQPAAVNASVLWDQPVSASNTNAYANQDFETVNDAYDIFIADDFVNGEAWNISTIFVPGGLWNGGTSLMNATTLNWQIYADDGGKPAGDPWGNGAAPVWAVSLAPTDPQVVISMGTDGLMGNTTVNLNVPALIPAGHWWLVFYPSMAFSTGGQFGRQWSDTTNGAVAQVVNPGGGFGIPTTWSSAQAAWGVSQQDFAFRLEGEIADVPWLFEDPQSGMTPAGDTSTVTITLDAGVPEVTQPGDYFAALNVKGDNATVAVPVTMTVAPPATWGKLTGLVQGLGYCDVMTTPLEGAVVFVESAMTEWVTYTVDSVVYEQDFESSGGGYTHSGVQDEWQWGTPTAWPGSCASGAYCWGTDLADTYNANADQTLLSPVIDLSGVTAGASLTASWQQAWYIESATWDHAYAEVSINGGPWVQMWAHTGSTVQTSWTGMSYDISAAAGGTVQFRWRLTSDSSVQYPGYYVDAVRITTPVEVVEQRPINWTLTTGADGMYGWWFDSAYSPFTVTVSHEGGHEALVFTGVNVTGEAVTTLNANLHWLQPCMSVAPDALAFNVPMGTATTVALNMANGGAATGSFLLNEWSLGFDQLGPLAAGGPDNFGYRYADSNSVGLGPTYGFVDISGVGTPVALGDNDYAEVNIGFNFKFYGTSAITPNHYSKLFVGSNGFLSFGAGSTDLSPDPVLPNPTLPNNLIAAAWDDLVPGTVYVQSFAQCPYNPAATTVDACFIVQYTDFTHKDGTPAGTWEVILFRTGSILMQYAEVNAPDATTGIEGPLGLDGLTYGPTLVDELAICFAYPGEWLDCQATQVPWLTTNVTEGDIAAYHSRTVQVTLDARVPEVSAPGTYMAELWMMTNDPHQAFTVIPVTMIVAQPATLTKLEGVVTGWSQCDAVSQTLAGAQVAIATSSGDNFVLTTDANGAYSAWVNNGDAYTITVSAAGYVPVTVTGIAETVMLPRNVALRADVPCINLSPVSYDVTLPKDRTTTRVLTIQNTGAGDFAYNNILGSSLWLSVAPKTGLVPAGSSVPVTVTFDATGLVAGDVYSTVLEVVHANPAVARLFVRPVRLTVLDTPQLLVDVVKTASPADVVLPGGLITYTVTITNGYDRPLDLTATDPIPANTTYVLASVYGGATIQDPPATLVTWAGTLAPDASATFGYVVRVGEDVARGTLITNTVTVATDSLTFSDDVVVLVGPLQQYIYLPLVLRNAQ